MSANLRQRLALGLLAFCAIVFITTRTAQGQKVIIGGVAPGAPGVKDKDKEEPRVDEFGFIIDDKKAPKIVESVLKHLKPELPAEDWKDIISNLQTLLDDPTDKLVEWTDPLTRKTNKESIRKVANKLIGRFSKQGREFYQKEQGPTADQRLKDAIERADYRLMNEVSLRYFHTKAGAEATVLMGRHHLDRGRYNSAAETFRRFMERNQDDPVPININFLAAVAWKRLSFLAAARNEKEDKDLYQKFANEFWEKVKKDAGGKAEIPFGPTQSVRFAQLEEEFTRLPKIPIPAGQFEWQGPRGNSQNNAQGVGSRPFLDSTWKFSLMPILDKEDQDKKGGGMAWIEQNLKQFIQLLEQRPNQTPIPAFFPVASSGKIIFRTYDGVYCLATRDDPQQNPPVKAGDMLWMVECEHSLYKMVEAGGPRNQMDTQWKTFYQQQGPLGVFFENGLIGSLTHDGSLVYFVDDIAVPPHPQMQMNYGFNGQPQIYGTFFQSMVFHNKLYAYNLETGKIVWKAGGRDGNKRATPPGEEEKETSASLLADAFFLGAPLPLGGKLYVVVEKDRELRLVCLDPSKVDPLTRHPELVWSQPLGSPNVPMPRDTLRRIQGIQLAYSDNVLVVPTNAGAVLGIDLLSHSIVWARSYRLAQQPVGDPNQPIGGRIRPINPNMNMNANLNADRWRTSTPIISNGRVVFTAYDSNSVMCLSLRDGEILWESTRSSDDLYVAGVFENRVLVVGKNQIKFLDLNKGSLVSTAQTGTPSGVGTASNDVYFLPIKPDRNNPEPEILSIDLKEMKVIAHTRSRKKVPTGNLVFFDNAVFSQTPFEVTSFPQLNVKIEDAKKRLAANDKDPIGLAEMGDLWLDDGKLNEAIDAFNRCLANNPNKDTRAKAREKLYDAITELLQRDFTGGEKMLKQYEELCDVEIPGDPIDALVRQRLVDEQLRRKSNYFCLVAKGKESQGKLVDAFENYLAFGSLTGNKDLISVIDQPNTMARPDVWARGRINHMLAKATPEQRKPLEEKALKEWEEVKKSGDVEKIRSFVRVFGTAFAAGNEARLLLAERLIATNGEEDLRDAEHVLLGLKSVEDLTYAAKGTEALARLYIRKGLLDDAMGLYDELNRLYPKVVIRDQKTGADLFNELITDKRFLPYLEPHRQTWIHSKLKAQDITAFQGNQQMQQFTITPDGESIPFFNRHRVVMDMQYQGSAMWTVKVVDRVTGEERFRSQPLTAPQYIYNMYPQTNNHRFAQIKGHMLILNLNHMVYAFDLADRKKLWEYNLFGKTPMPNIYPTRMENESDGVRLHYADGWSHKVGKVGVIESSYVCLITRDGLVAVDPARGNVLWTKSNVAANVQLMGDDNFVFVFESNAEGGVTSARAVRASDGVEIQIQDSAQVFSNLKKSKTAGRRVLVLDEKGEKKAMRLYDVLTGKDDWKKEIEGNAILLRCDDPNLTGYVSDKGDVSVFSVKDGKEIFSGKLDARKLAQQMDKVETGVLLVDRDRFYVVLNRAIDNNARFNNMLAVTPGMRTLHVNGTIYCFDRVTKRRLWFTEEQFENQQIILDQFQDLPVMIGAHYYNRINNGVFEGNHFRVVALDKQTGRTLFRKEVSPNGPFHALASDPKTGVIELIRSDLRIRFSPDDKPSGSLPGVPVGMAQPNFPPQIGIAVPVQLPIRGGLRIQPVQIEK